MNQCVANRNSAQGTGATKQGFFCVEWKTIAPRPPVQVTYSADLLADSLASLTISHNVQECSMSHGGELIP